MSYLRNTYGFVYGDLIQAIARSTNLHGTSEYSSVNTVGAIAYTPPTFMYPVTEGPNTVKDAIELLWDPLTQDYQTGGVPILNYYIWWDQGGSVWAQLAVIANDPAVPREYMATGLVNNRTH